jgi:hypothetical protein
MVRLGENTVAVPKDVDLKTEFVFTETNVAPELNSTELN